jgi:hypothetical protein
MGEGEEPTRRDLVLRVPRLGRGDLSKLLDQFLLAVRGPNTHIPGMAARTSSATPKSSKPGTVLGRSAATGRYVLSPASKGSSISVREASRAAKVVQGKKK